MDSFEFNKILGALLGALTLFVGVLVFSDILFEDHAPETPGYIVEVPEEGEAEVAAFVTPLPVLLASASVEDGEAFVRACASCHNFGQGEPNKVGPVLWGVHDRNIAALPDFGYSDALTALSDQPWSFENMDGFLKDPRGWAPGTTMGYAGIRRDTDRANVLAYLNSLSDNPDVLPTEEEAAAILAEAQAAFEAAQGGGEGGEGVALDEAVEGGNVDASEVNPVVTGEDIAVEENEDAAVVEDAETEVAPEAPIVESTDPAIETDPGAAPVAVPSQQTVPATPNAAQPGTIANPNDAVERDGAEGHSPAAAQPGPSPGVEAEDTAGAEAQGTAGTEANTAPAANTAPETTTAPEGTPQPEGGAQAVSPTPNVTVEPAPAPNVTTTIGEPQVEIAPAGEPEVIIVPTEN